jgi:hypothetical protein
LDFTGAAKMNQLKEAEKKASQLVQDARKGEKSQNTKIGMGQAMLPCSLHRARYI